jgi:hypothetical protein
MRIDGYQCHSLVVAKTIITIINPLDWANTAADKTLTNVLIELWILASDKWRLACFILCIQLNTLKGTLFVPRKHVLYTMF